MIQSLAFYIGAVLVLGVTLRLPILLFSSWQRISHKKEQNRLSLQLMEASIQYAREKGEEARKLEGAWQGERKFELKDKVEEVDGVCSFYLQPHDRKALPHFKPGQFLTFSLKILGQKGKTIRCYSLSDAPNEQYYRVTIKKIPPPPNSPELPSGLSSSYFVDTLQPGDILDVRAPGGHFYLDKSHTEPVVLIGGGIGITPVLSMLNDIIASQNYREVHFFLGVRNSNEHMMKTHLEAVALSNKNVHLHICYSEPLESDREGKDFQHKGWVGVDLFKEVLPSSNFDFYICGPPPMMESVVHGLEGWGVPSEAIHFEAFGPATVKKTTKVAETDEKKSGEEKVSVEFASSEKKVMWSDNQESLLEFAEEHDIRIDSGCRSGNCGTCIVAIKSGKVKYMTEPGVPVEAGSCLTCCCVPDGALVLDA